MDHARLTSAGVGAQLAADAAGRLRDRVVVIKIGGAVVADREALRATARDVATLFRLGARPLVVHGAGPQIDATLEALGRPVKRVDGIRVTDEATLEVVEMVLGGRVNQQVVAALGRHALPAVGLTGRDAGWLRAEPVRGRVGRPTTVRMDLPLRLQEHGFIPVIAPLCAAARGRTLNVNADVAAAAIAVAVGACGLSLVTGGGAVRGANGAALEELRVEGIDAAIEAGVIHGGMIPKVEAAATARRGGVRHVHVLGPTELATTGALFGTSGAGTRVR